MILWDFWIHSNHAWLRRGSLSNMQTSSIWAVLLNIRLSLFLAYVIRAFIGPYKHSSFLPKPIIYRLQLTM